MPILKHKVFAYITHDDRLLVFRHPYSPEVGIQVPAGTVEAGEQPDEAVMQEAFEETGLQNLKLSCFLGEYERDMSDFGKDEIHHRRFYHLRCDGNPPDSWRHNEHDPSEGAFTEPIVFEFFWARLPHEIPELIAEHDKMLQQLLKVLSLGSLPQRLLGHHRPNTGKLP